MPLSFLCYDDSALRLITVICADLFRSMFMALWSSVECGLDPEFRGLNRMFIVYICPVDRTCYFFFIALVFRRGAFGERVSLCIRSLKPVWLL